MNIYVELTREFNAAGLNAILSSGQAVVFHRLAIMSKDGDWIVRETQAALDQLLAVLETHGAFYRFGAPFDLRWMRGGWSAHLEFRNDGIRIRTDFVTRPPRLSEAELQEIWRNQAGRDMPVIDARDLIEIKKTNREKDYAIIGELARLLSNPREQLLASRSARDIMVLVDQHPDLLPSLVDKRPALAAVVRGIEALEAAIDAERRALIHANERRLMRYSTAAARWAEMWPEVSKQVSRMPLADAHRIVVERAVNVLPCDLPAEKPRK
jgi:hypothetical protein